MEIGPIASGTGAQTNVPNVFTAPQTVDADFQTKGPNPSYYITRYGGYVGPNYSNTSGTTGSISSASNSLTIANALDFANGQGILILGAGPAPTIAHTVGSDGRAGRSKRLHNVLLLRGCGGLCGGADSLQFGRIGGDGTRDDRVAVGDDQLVHQGGGNRDVHHLGDA